MKKTVVYFIGLLAFSLNAALAYEPTTHEEMSEHAFDTSVLKKDDKVLKHLGLKSLEEKEELPNSKGNKKTIAQLFRDGANFEDEVIKLKSLFHFFDPLNDQGLLFFTSPTWALEDKGKIHFLQNYSFSDARDAFYVALTTTDENQQKSKFGKTFESLGHVIHHIQDMAQPQHVRLDPHLNLDWTKEELPIENRSRYELHTRDKGGNLPFNTYAPVNLATDTNFLTTGRSFWHTAQGGGMGLAEFTNSNFVSAGTNFRGAFQNGGIIARPNERYSLPTPSPITPSFELANDLLGPDTPVECSPPNNPCVMAFFSSEVKDNYRQTSQVNDRASTASIFDQDLQLYGKTVSYPNLDQCADPNNPDTCEKVETGQIFSLNSFNFDETHKYLIPRAVAYSSGLIDYFFRGRLEGEDVTFTDTGVSLKLKNAIDTEKYPAWANEVLYAKNSTGASSKLVVAFEYKDSTGTTRYGISDLVPVRATDNLSPGQVSSDVYEFPLTVPFDAKDVNYRLVFRGKLGQEEDAVAVGAIEPVSGVIVGPSYIPADGISGFRAIYRQGGQWRLSSEQELVAGNIDWKGWYVNGKPTKVLSWNGPATRYFPEPRPVFGTRIFQDGEVFANAPMSVLGAAIARDDAGKEWLIAVCTDFYADIVYRRPNRKSDSQELHDPVLNPEGWEEIGYFEPEPGMLPQDRPWFFNGSGTEAQTMRRDNSDLHNGVSRLKLVLNTSSMRANPIDNLRNLSGFKFERSTSNGAHVVPPPPNEPCSGYVATHNEEKTENLTGGGKYIVAVDYRDAEEVPGIIEVVAEDHLTANYDRELTVTVTCNEDGGVISTSSTISGINDELATSAYREWLSFKNIRWPISTIDSETRGHATPSSGGSFDGSYKQNYSFRYIVFFDLRHDLVSEWGYDFIFNAGYTDTGSSGSQTETETGMMGYRGENLPVYFKSSEFPECSSCPATFSFSLPLYPWTRSVDIDPVTQVTVHGPNSTTFGPIGDTSAWTVTSNGELVVSQSFRATLLEDKRGVFNYLTGGDFSDLIPPGPADASYNPIGLIK